MNHSQLDPLPKDLPFDIISKTIGRGAYASVKLGRVAATQEVFAVKFIHKRHALEMSRVSLNQLNTEVALHKHCGPHANLIQFFASGDDDIWLWIAMEYASGGELFDKIEADVGLPEDISHFYFTQLVAGVSYIHGQGIAHRDIKPENILLDSNGNLKIADFGLAVLFQHKGVYKLSKTVCGSPPYVAPEVEPTSANIVDIWSCAVVLFVLLAGNTPWDEPTTRSLEFQEFVAMNGRPDYEPWPKIPQGVISLLRGMMKLNPEERFRFDDVRRHPWFTRENKYLAQDGKCLDGVNLATKMMEALHIDFNVDSQESEASHRMASTQPITPVGDMQFEWERPQNHHMHPASQPLAVPDEFNSQDLWASLADDPSMSQFAPQPRLPISLNARRFNDIAPSSRLTRFYSSYSFRQILPILSGALHRLGIMVPTFKESDYDEHNAETWISVKTEDSRKCLLRGDIIVERMAPDMLQVTFSKNVGDPLEWRRFFKRVAVLSKEAIFTPTQG